MARPLARDPPPTPSLPRTLSVPSIVSDLRNQTEARMSEAAQVSVASASRDLRRLARDSASDMARISVITSEMRSAVSRADEVTRHAAQKMNEAMENVSTALRRAKLAREAAEAYLEKRSGLHSIVALAVEKVATKANAMLSDLAKLSTAAEAKATPRTAPLRATGRGGGERTASAAAPPAGLPRGDVASQLHELLK